jgi:hypothetical protein
MLSVIVLNVIMLTVTWCNVVLLYVVMLSVIMLSVMAPTRRLKHYKCDQLTCAETEVEVFLYLSSLSVAFIRKRLQYL